MIEQSIDCNQYYCTVVYLLIICIAILIVSWNIIEKKPSGHVGTRTCVAGLSQQTYYELHHHASPNDA